MKPAYAFLAAAALFVDPTPALAGSSCGGGSSGGSSGGGSSSGGSSGGGGGGGGGDYSSSSYDSSDSGSSSASSGCIDDTDVHGFRRCTKFGAWAGNMRLPRLFFEVGSNVRNFSSGLASDQTGTIAHGTESFAYRVVMPTADVARDTAMVSTLRIGAGVTRHVYAGVEGELGGLVAPARASAEMTTSGTFGAPIVEQGRGLVIGVAGIAGLRMGTGRATLALEGAGGLRSVRYRFTSTYHNCVTDTTVESTTSLLEARARGELWLNPWLTAGATLGSNVLERNDWMAGVYFGIHTRAFGGGR